MQGLHTTVQKNLLGSDEFEDWGPALRLAVLCPASIQPWSAAKSG